MLLYMRRFSFYIYKVSNSVLQRHEMTQKHKNHLFTVGISGKIFARVLHAGSPRASRTRYTIDCARLQPIRFD